MRDEDFVEVSAYLRVLEKRVLSGSDIDRISDAQDVTEALRQISQNSEYDFSTLKRTEDYEFVLKSGLKSMYDLMDKMVEHRIVIDLATAKYDFHNLRVLMKSMYLGVDASYLYSDLSNLDMAEAKTFLTTGESNNLAPYVKEALSEAKTAFDDTKDPQDIDIIMDRRLFARMLEICDVIKSEFITEYVRHSIDFHNLKTFLRVKEMRKGTRFLNGCLCPGGLLETEYFLANYDKTPEMLSTAFYYKYFGNIVGKGIDGYIRTGSFGIMEKLLDDYLVDYIKKAKYVAFGPEVPFAYILSKENEARQIRVLVTCKNNNMRMETLKERLRENYA